VAVPAATPVTRPVSEPIVALAIALLLHMPPVVAFDNRVVAPIHAVEAPVIGVDNGPTVMVVVTNEEDTV
jgi:hypothetical protein